MEPTTPIRRPPLVRPLRKGERNFELEAKRAQAREIVLAEQRAGALERASTNEAGAQQMQHDYDTVMTALKRQAIQPISSSEYNQASQMQKVQAVNDAQVYKNAVNSLITLGELGFSGTSLLGAYANWRRWAQSASAYKAAMANLLQRAQLPAQVGGTIIDGVQTYKAPNDFEMYYNGASGGLGVLGTLGAADLFGPKVDRMLDVGGIIQSGGDFVKYGYDLLKPKQNDKK